MASSNLMALQATVNRLADKVGYSLIPVDGGMGAMTQKAVAAALAWVGDGGSFFSSVTNPVTVGAARGLSANIGTGITALTSTAASRIMANLVLINNTLTSAANELNLPSAAQPSAPPPRPASPSGFATTSPTTLNTTLTPPPPPPGKGGVLARIGKPLGLSSTQTVLFLAMLGGVGFLAVRRMRARA